MSVMPNPGSLKFLRRPCRRAGEEECKFYKKYLKCSFGASCKFDHPELTVDWMPVGRSHPGTVPPPGIPRHSEPQDGLPQDPTTCSAGVTPYLVQPDCELFMR